MATKGERKKEQLQKHYNALEKLATLCGVKNPDGKKLSIKLLRLEIAGREFVQRNNDSNGNLTTEEMLNELRVIEEDVQNLFNRNLKGFDTNTDPRGSCLKIDDEVMRNEYRETGLFTDFVGNGLLSPTLDGSK